MNTAVGVVLILVTGSLTFAVLKLATRFGAYVAQSRRVDDLEKEVAALKARPHVAVAITQIPQEKSA